MLKALIRKQFLEISQFYFRDKKTGKNRSKAGTILYVLLFAAIFLMVGLSVLMIAMIFGAAILLGQGYEWLYFAYMGLITVVCGVIGSVFNTYASLYLSKDNEQLLAMPIPPSKILLSRMTAVFATGLLFSAIAWIPSVVCYWLMGGLSIPGVIFPLLMLIFITLLVSALTCFFGWILAMLSRKVKGKSYITVILALAFLAVYYYFYFHFISGLSDMTLHIGSMEQAVRGWLYPFYILGRAAGQDIPSFVIFALVSLAAMLLCWYLMSINFVRIATTSTASSKREFSEEQIRQGDMRRALFTRELRHFTSSSVYMLNCGLGVVMLLAAAAAAIIKHDAIGGAVLMLETNLPGLKEYIIPAVTLCVCAIASMDCITAPSVSLEGRNLWIVRSLPITTLDILRAKADLHIAINVIPAVITDIILCILLRADLLSIVVSAITVILAVWLSADFGLFTGIHKPNLSWTNEAVPIKQGVAVVISIFGAWAFIALLAGGIYLLRNILPSVLIPYIIMVVFAALIVLCELWIKNTGVKKFEEL